MACYDLWGNICSLQSVRLVGGERETILLTFWDAKLSGGRLWREPGQGQAVLLLTPHRVLTRIAVEYDPETHDLKTVSMHYFEDAEMHGGLTQNNLLPEVGKPSRCLLRSRYALTSARYLKRHTGRLTPRL